MIQWTSADGANYDELDEVYSELISLWRGYIYHVITNVGGVYQTFKTADQEGVVYEPVPKEIQQNAINFLNTNGFTTPKWLLDNAILDRIEADGAIARVQNLQTRSMNYLLDADRITRMSENAQRNKDAAYTPLAMLNEVRKGVYKELYTSKAVDAYRRNLQRSYIDAAAKVVKKAKMKDGEELLKSDIVALMRGELQRFKERSQ